MVDPSGLEFGKAMGCGQAPQEQRTVDAMESSAGVPTNLTCVLENPSDDACTSKNRVRLKS
jgi:hypothetical protein